MFEGSFRNFNSILKILDLSNSSKFERSIPSLFHLLTGIEIDIAFCLGKGDTATINSSQFLVLVIISPLLKNFVVYLSFTYWICHFILNTHASVTRSRIPNERNSQKYSQVICGHGYWSLRILVNISRPIKWHDEVKFVRLWNYRGGQKSVPIRWP